MGRTVKPGKGQTMTDVQAHELTWTTERRNDATRAIDQRDAAALVDVILTHDETVAAAVRAVADRIAEAVDLMVGAITAGGVVHYVGAGTSGRLGVLDAVELFPTYDAGPELIRAHLAGGDTAMTAAVEGAEDDAAAGAEIAAAAGLNDLIVGIAASGRTPFVTGALHAAHDRGLPTVLISMNPAAPAAEYATVAVLPDTGPEVVTGSTRMKAGTATKLVLNAMSTAAMVRLGRTYENLMIDMRITNAKLAARAVRMVSEAAGVPLDEAATTRHAAGDTRTALVALLAGGQDIDLAQARAALARHPRDATRAGDPSGIRTAAAELRRSAHREP